MSIILPFKAKKQYLVRLHVSRYYIVALQSSMGGGGASIGYESIVACRNVR